MSSSPADSVSSVGMVSTSGWAVWDNSAKSSFDISKEDLAELSQTAQPDVDTIPTDETESAGDEDISLDQVSENENQAPETSSDDTETSNS